MASSEELAILIRAQQQTQAAFEGARKDLAGLRQESQQTNQTLGLLKGGLGALGIAFSATAVLGFAKDIVDTAGNIGDLSQALKISTDAVQDFKQGAETSGATIDDVGRAINRLNVEAGNGAAGFEKLGLPLAKIQAMSPEDRFRAVADALKDIEDPAVRAALGQELLGKGYEALAAAIDDGIGSMHDANKMSEDTIHTLKWLGDTLVETGIKAKNFGGEVLAAAVNAPRDLWRRMNADLEQLGISIENVTAKAPAMIAAFASPGGKAGFTIKGRGINPEDEEQIVEALNKERKALDETSKAVDRHADSIKKLQDQIFGRNLITAANDYVQALGKMSNLSKVNGDEQKKMNEAAGRAIDQYKLLGQTAPAAMLELYNRTVVMPPLIDTTALSIEKLGHQVDVVIPTLYDMPKAIAFTPEALRLIEQQAKISIPEIPKQTKLAVVSIGDLARSIGTLANIAGGSFASVARDIGSVVGAASTAVESIKAMKAAAAAKDKLDGILGMTSGILGIVTAAIQAGKAIADLFNRDKGRDLVEDFAKSFGGFDQLHDKLLEMGDAGEQLWIKLTQGVGRNNPEQAQRVIDEVNAALDKQAQKQDEVQDQTEESAKATIETATEASQALDLVGEKLDTNKGQWADWSSAVMSEISKVASSLGALVVGAPAASEAPGFAGGTHGAYVDFGVGTPVVLHGRERVMTEAEGRSSNGWGMGPVIVQIDGREIARASVQYQKSVLSPYGVR